MEYMGLDILKEEKIIRLGTHEDVVFIAYLWEQMVKESMPEYTPNRLWWENMCRNLLSTGIYWIVVAESKGLIVGFIDGFVYPEPSTGMTHLVGQHFYLLPEYRKSGLGGRLYRTLMKIGKEKGAQKQEFFCFCADQNRWAKKGFQPIRTMMRR